MSRWFNTFRDERAWLELSQVFRTERGLSHAAPGKVRVCSRCELLSLGSRSREHPLLCLMRAVQLYR